MREVGVHLYHHVRPVMLQGMGKAANVGITEPAARAFEQMDVCVLLRELTNPGAGAVRGVIVHDKHVHVPLRTVAEGC